jgi:hypothetical protein
MKMMNFDYIFFAIAALVIASPIFCMDTPPKPKKTKIRSIQRSAQQLQEYLITKISGKKNSDQSPTSSRPFPLSSDVKEPFPFLDLPQEVQIFLMLEANADTVEEAGYIITQLAQTNTTLNKAINDPGFCLRIIDTLSKRFNCSNFKACSALKTQVAKYRLAAQNELYLLCTQSSEYNDLGRSVELLRIIKKHYTQFDFTYDYNSTQVTPLILCIQLNLNIKYSLLVAGANPELPAGGITPLQAAEQVDDKEFIKALKEAIEKKHVI